jgi:hypothetical protein
MSWQAVESRPEVFAPVWEKKGSITWEVRKAIGSATDEFVYDEKAKKGDNLARILEKVAPECKDVVESAIGLKRTVFFDKLKSGLDEEKTLLAESTDNHLADYVLKTEPVDAMDLDSYGQPVEIASESVDSTLAFLDSLL